MGKKDLDLREHDILVKDDKEYYSVRYVSKILDKTHTTIRNYMKIGKLKYIQEQYPFGKMYYIEADSVADYFDQIEYKMNAYANSKLQLINLFDKQLNKAFEEHNKPLIDEITLLRSELQKLIDIVEHRDDVEQPPKKQSFFASLFDKNRH